MRKIFPFPTWRLSEPGHVPVPRNTRLKFWFSWSTTTTLKELNLKIQKFKIHKLKIFQSFHFFSNFPISNVSKFFNFVLTQNSKFWNICNWKIRKHWKIGKKKWKDWKISNFWIFEFFQFQKSHFCPDWTGHLWTSCPL